MIKDPKLLHPLALHEAGHALQAWFSPEVQAVAFVSASQGMTRFHLWRSPNGRPSGYWALIVGHLGGVAAELLNYGSTFGQMSRGDVGGAIDLADGLIRLSNGTSFVDATQFEPQWSLVKRFIDQISQEHRLKPETTRCLSNACHHAISTLTAHQPQFERIWTALQHGDLTENDLMRMLGQRTWANQPPI